MPDSSAGAGSFETSSLDVSSFDRTKAFLVSAGYDLVDSRPHDGILETKNALYKVIEKQVHEVNTTRADVGDAAKEAYDKKKNFAVHAAGVDEAVIAGIQKNGQDRYHQLIGLHAIVATSAMQVEKSIATVESPRSAGATPVGAETSPTPTAKVSSSEWIVAVVIFIAQLLILAIWADNFSHMRTAYAAFGLALATLAILINLFVKFRRLRDGRPQPKLSTIYLAVYLGSCALLSGEDWREKSDAWSAGLTVALGIYAFLSIVGLILPASKKAKIA